MYSQQKKILNTNSLQFPIEFLILLSWRRKFCTWNTVKNCWKCWKKKFYFVDFYSKKKKKIRRRIGWTPTTIESLLLLLCCFLFCSILFQKKNLKWLLYFNAFETLSFFFIFSSANRVGETQTGNEKYLCWNR